LRNRDPKRADGVTKNNALLSILRQGNRVRTVSGGRTICQPIEFAENGTFKRYSGYENLNISPSEVLTMAEFNWAQAAVGISISGLEMLQNSGKEEVINLLEARIENAEHTLMNNIALDIYSDGTADGGRQIGGLQLLVSSTPSTGTVGGIDASQAAAAPFWRNSVFSALSNGGASANSGNIQSYMNRLYVDLVRGRDRPNLIVADNNYFRIFQESMQAIQRVMSSNEALLGFATLKYMDIDVVLDGGVGGGTPANTMYFLNTKYLYFRPHTARHFMPIGESRQSINADAMVKFIGFAGNMTCSLRRLQGVLTA
jgi:hypothetical protein